MTVLLKSAQLNVAPAAAWEVVDRFMRADIRVFSFIDENRIEGDLRTVVSGGGSLEQPELNITIDPEQMYASYTLLESSFFKSAFHYGSMRVIDTGDGGCRFDWTTDIAPESAAVQTHEFIETYGLWTDLLKVLETGREAPLAPTA